MATAIPIKFKQVFYVLVAFLIAAALLLWSGIFIAKEGFENVIESDSQQINTFMTAASELLCPAYNFVIDDMKKEITGSDAEKQVQADLQMVKSAGGPLFPCPPPADAIAVPADIDMRIQRSITYFLEKSKELKEKVTAALNCPTKGVLPSMPSVEKFQNICTQQELLFREQKADEEAAAAAAGACVAPQDVGAADKRRILKARRATLARVMTDKEMTTKMMMVKKSTDDIKTIKMRAESGDIQSLCPY